MKAIIKMNKGDINLELHADKAPLTVANFANLAGRGYYDGLTFHRVIENFMIQGGCPQGNGRGGPGYTFRDECTPELQHDRSGILSMANAGPNTNGSQFFITHVPTEWLNGKHTVFGHVAGAEDLKVVNSVVQGDTIKTVEIIGDTSALFAEAKADLDKWNKILDRK